MLDENDWKLVQFCYVMCGMALVLVPLLLIGLSYVLEPTHWAILLSGIIGAVVSYIVCSRGKRR